MKKHALFLLSVFIVKLVFAQENRYENLVFEGAGISPKIKKLSKEQKEPLVKRGQLNTRNFLNK